MKIVPIVLETAIPAFEEIFQKVASLSDRINIDIADGVAAPNRTVSLEEALGVVRRYPSIQTKKLDFDLMVKDWKPLVEQLVKVQQELQIGSVVIHQKYFRSPPPAEFDIGVAIDLDDEINFKAVNKVSVVQVMTIGLGFQGSLFHEDALKKITELRLKGFEGQIIIDGGVNDKTLPLILANKGQPDIVGVGSFLTHVPSPVENLRKLEEIIVNYET